MPRYIAAWMVMDEDSYPLTPTSQPIRRRRRPVSGHEIRLG
jgi:hypothetical protein